MKLSVVVLLMFGAGCRSLPEAPDTLEELTNYIFTHYEDEEDASLEAGIRNMHDWLSQHYDEANEGYRVDDLSLAAVQGLGENAIVDGQIGAAVGYDLRYDPESLIGVTVGVAGDVINPDYYTLYEREFITDPDCFLNQTCDTVSYQLKSISHFPLSIDVTSWNQTEMRRVMLGDTAAIVSRNWMTQPAEINQDWINVDQQYYISVMIPCGTATRRLDAGWIIASLGELPLPEDLAVLMAVDSMRDSGLALGKYLEEH